MSTLAPLLEAFFTERLIGQREASPHTVAAYRDTFCLLLRFAQRRTGKPPYELDVADLDAPFIGAFLAHLEAERGVTVRTRNARLSAIRSLFRYAAYRHPEQAGLIQRVLAIPPKRSDRALVTFLTVPEIDALLASPDRTRWIWSSRSCPARRRAPDGAPGLRADRTHLRRRRIAYGRACPVPWQGPQAAHHPAHRPDPGCRAHLAV